MTRKPLMELNRTARWPWVGLILCYPAGMALLWFVIEANSGFPDFLFFSSLTTVGAATGFFSLAIFETAAWARTWPRGMRYSVAFLAAILNGYLFVGSLFLVANLLNW